MPNILYRDLHIFIKWLIDISRAVEVRAPVGVEFSLPLQLKLYVLFS